MKQDKLTSFYAVIRDIILIGLLPWVGYFIQDITGNLWMALLTMCVFFMLDIAQGRSASVLLCRDGFLGQIYHQTATGVPFENAFLQMNIPKAYGMRKLNELLALGGVFMLTMNHVHSYWMATLACMAWLFGTGLVQIWAIMQDYTRWGQKRA